MRKNNEGKNDSGKLNFEESIMKLEQIVNKMEEGRLPLEDMMKNFEDATKLAEQCTTKLKEIEAKIEILIDKNKNNKSGEWKPFDSEEKSDIGN